LVIEMLRNGKFPVEQTISVTVPLKEAGEALQRWNDAPQSYTKILVEMDA
jgi:threonine dehydrogenase-like Zn-dependent dehydrogenase